MKRVNTLLGSALLCGVAASPFSFADTVLGLYVGAGVWQSDFSGDVGSIPIDLNDLGVQEQDGNVLFVALEHPIPIIPNIRLQTLDLNYEQTAVVSQSFEFDDQIFTANDTIHSDFDLSHTDFTLYYEVLDNWVSLDLGLTGRVFDGYVFAESLTTPSDSERIELDETIPLLYLNAQFELPLTGLYIAAGGNFVSYDGHSLRDYSLGLGYQTDGLVLDFGIEAGIRKFTVELDNLDDELNANIELDGMYFTAFLHF